MTQASLAACICATAAQHLGSRQVPKIGRIAVAYIDPINRAHEAADNLVKERNALDHLRTDKLKSDSTLSGRPPQASRISKQ